MKYQWWDVATDGRTRHTVFRMLTSVTEECALFTVPSIKLADQIMYALRTAYDAGLTAGRAGTPITSAHPRHDGLATLWHRVSLLHDNTWQVDGRTYTLTRRHPHMRQPDETYEFERPAIRVRTRKLVRALASELDRAWHNGYNRATESRRLYCHGHDGPCPKCTPAAPEGN